MTQKSAARCSLTGALRTRSALLEDGFDGCQPHVTGQLSTFSHFWTGLNTHDHVSVTRATFQVPLRERMSPENSCFQITHITISFGCGSECES